MLELLGTLGTLGWFELTAAGLSILAVVGGLMNRAFLKPLKEEIDDLKGTQDEHDTRLRQVEKTQAEHGVEISTVKEVAMKLVDRMDKILDRFTSKDD